MKKNFKLATLFFALIAVVISAFAATTSFNKTKVVPASTTMANELYWYAADNTTYTGRFANSQDEMSSLATAQPLYNFYSTPVSGSIPYEYGYTVQSPSGSPTETIYRKAK